MLYELYLIASISLLLGKFKTAHFLLLLVMHCLVTRNDGCYWKMVEESVRMHVAET